MLDLTEEEMGYVLALLELERTRCHSSNMRLNNSITDKIEEGIIVSHHLSFKKY